MKIKIKAVEILLIIISICLIAPLPYFAFVFFMILTFGEFEDIRFLLLFLLLFGLSVHIVFCILNRIFGTQYSKRRKIYPLLFVLTLQVFLFIGYSIFSFIWLMTERDSFITLFSSYSIGMLIAYFLLIAFLINIKIQTK